MKIPCEGDLGWNIHGLFGIWSHQIQLDHSGCTSPWHVQFTLPFWIDLLGVDIVWQNSFCPESGASRKTPGHMRIEANVEHFYLRSRHVGNWFRKHLRLRKLGVASKPQGFIIIFLMKILILRDTPFLDKPKGHMCIYWHQNKQLVNISTGTWLFHHPLLGGIQVGK